jgi:hypothetical protein
MDSGSAYNTIKHGIDYSVFRDVAEPGWVIKYVQNILIRFYKKIYETNSHVSYCRYLFI